MYCPFSRLPSLQLQLSSLFAWRREQLDARANGFTFRRVDAPFPGVTETQANGINDQGPVVGFYVVGGATHGYIDDRGSFTTVDVPFPGATDTALGDINNRVQIVGTYSPQETSFLDDRGTFSIIAAPFPGTDQTLVFKINNEGQIVGGYHNNTGFHGFIDDRGAFSPVDVPFRAPLHDRRALNSLAIAANTTPAAPNMASWMIREGSALSMPRFRA